MDVQRTTPGCTRFRLHSASCRLPPDDLRAPVIGEEGKFFRKVDRLDHGGVPLFILMGPMEEDYATEARSSQRKRKKRNGTKLCFSQCPCGEFLSGDSQLQFGK